MAARLDVDEKSITCWNLLFAFVWLSGFLFGLDFGITDGLLSMPDFLELYFPSAYKNMTSNSHIPDSLCCGGDFLMNLYRSSIYLVAAFIMACMCTVFRDPTIEKMKVGALLMVFGTTISAACMISNIVPMTCGRIVFGMGIGAIFQAVATHALEIDPTCRYQRRVMALFALAISSGMLMANLWFFVSRISAMEIGMVLPVSLSILDMVSVFNLGFTVCATGGFNKLLMDGGSQITLATYSLIQKERISPSSSIFLERKLMPPLVLAVCVSIFQQLTGVYAFMIYAPVLFRTMGLGERASLSCSCVLYGVNFIVTCLSSSIATVKFGTRRLFMQGGITMLLCQIFITLFHENLFAMPAMWNAILLVVAMSVYVAGFAWSWGPLGWILPSQILPSEIQSTGYSLCVIVNMLSMSFVTQFFTKWLCDLRLGMHLVISSLVLSMTIFVYLLLPETKGVEVNNVSEIWNTHWFWKKFIEEEDKIGCLVSKLDSSI